ncbi:MAG: carbohydrate-binding protein, partial [Clostridiaceae bacterium]|nr:carbohydrate-binding protein [Clostridiaceae bacterium]
TGNTGNTGNIGNTGGNTNTSGPVIIQSENMLKSGQYTGNINSPFNGVALYANNDSIKLTHNFASNTSSFSLRGCSNNNNMARVDLRIGGEYKGSFYYGGSYPAVYTINNVSHGTGNQVVELIVTTDNGTWDAFLDYLQIN